VVDLLALLDEPEQNAWNEYVSFEDKNLRKPALRALDQFIAGVNDYPRERKEAWVFAFRRACGERDKSVSELPCPLRLPLVRDVLYPVLATAYEEGKPNSARGLAACLYAKYCRPGEKHGRYPDEYRTLLEAAFRQDPNDGLARSLLHSHLLTEADSMPVPEIEAILREALDRDARRDALISSLSSWFHWSLHHLPLGVICQYENDPQNLVDKLNLFCRLVAEAGRTEQFADDISFWRLHFEGYVEYLENLSMYQSCAEYLSKHGRL
jgi:hypothetical protein